MLTGAGDLGAVGHPRLPHAAAPACGRRSTRWRSRTSTPGGATRTASGSFYGDRFASLVDKQPNAAHRALAELERRGLIRGVITQNIDRLHRVAGTRAADRGARLDRAERLPRVRRQGRARAGGRAAARATTARPSAPCCFTPLKPDVVLFGELLPERALAEAQALALDADLMVCVGSSLEVYPVAGLPAITPRRRRAARARHPGPDPLRRRRRGQAGRRRGRRAAGGAGRAVNAHDRRRSIAAPGGGAGGDRPGSTGEDDERRRRPARPPGPSIAAIARRRRAGPRSCASSTCRACGT